MSQSIKDFDFSRLDAAERVLLAQELWNSVHDEMQAAILPPGQREELQRRLADLESGQVQGIPWEELRQSLLSKP